MQSALAEILVPDFRMPEFQYFIRLLPKKALWRSVCLNVEHVRKLKSVARHTPIVVAYPRQSASHDQDERQDDSRTQNGQSFAIRLNDIPKDEPSHHDTQEQSFQRTRVHEDAYSEAY